MRNNAVVQNYDFIYYDVAGTEILYQACAFSTSFSKNNASQSMFEWERRASVPHNRSWHYT
jgi:hypothetical protein